MKPQVRIFIGIATSVVFLINTTTAQEHSQVETLNEVLRQSVCERISDPLVFSTRDTLFALSLPTNEPATIYLQLTVGRNGKVKKKQTKVHANHMAQYVAPAFVEAAKGLRVDRELLAKMQNKDTSLLVEFPMEYCHMLDTTINPSRADVHPYRSQKSADYMIWPWIKSFPQLSRYSQTPLEIFNDNPYHGTTNVKKQPDRGLLSFYVAFIQEPEKE